MSSALSKRFVHDCPSCELMGYIGEYDAYFCHNTIRDTRFIVGKTKDGVASMNLPSVVANGAKLRNADHSEFLQAALQMAIVQGFCTQTGAKPSGHTMDGDAFARLEKKY